MTHKTKGIVLRAIKYGETSLVLTVFTELFGIQTYMVNGVRTNKKSGAKAAMYQPAAILDMEVYHNDLKSMHRIRECNWSIIYKEVLSDVIKNSIALYMVELLYKTLKQPEQQTDLFYFCEDALKELDMATPPVAANFALYFSLHLTHFFGLRFSNIGENKLAAGELFLDLVEGCFTTEAPTHPRFLAGENALITVELLKVMQPAELAQLKLNHVKRRELLLKFHEYYVLHFADFGQMKTLTVMHEVLN